ncbi:ATP-binding protein [Streptomyces mirabilis]|uniref:ATP-binding protein n=1 Tax=Streptomyces mirabilis TaxID=68239 RepID=UPI0036826C5D
MAATAVDKRRIPSPRPVRDGHEVSIQRDPASVSGRLSARDAVWPGRCRRIVRAALRHWRQTNLVDTAELLTSELVTNALRHGCGPDIGMRLYLSGARLVIEIRDGSAVLPALRAAAPDDEDGRGLALVNAMADDWGTSPDGTTTWCSLPLCEGPDELMQRAAAPIPVLREYPIIALPGASSAVTRARTIARSGLTVIGWRGDVHAAAEVVARLVDNAVSHGVTPDVADKGVSIRLRISEAGQLLIEVSDPNPKFLDFEGAIQREQGRGLWEVQRLHAEVTWFQNGTGKTVRATMTPGAVDL